MYIVGIIKVKVNFLTRPQVLPVLRLIFTIFLFSVLILTPNHHTSGQVPQTAPPQLESVKILDPVPSQNVDLKKELIVSGQSSDNASKDCSVYVLVNGIQPYQNAQASGAGGTTDFSEWKFALHEQYTHVIEGSNKITAKLLCETSPTRWYSVTVNGISSSSFETVLPEESTQQSNASESVLPQGSTSESLLPEESTQQSNASESVLPEESTQQSNASESVLPQGSTSESVLPEESTQQSNASESVLPEESTQQSKLLVTILPLKNPAARGDTQNATIIVTDSNNKTVREAQITGKLIYPGNNFEKDFKGITDLNGEFVYSWTIGKKGDEGNLSIEIEVSSQGYPPAFANNSFEIVKSSDSSKIENPFQSNFESP